MRKLFYLIFILSLTSCIKSDEVITAKEQLEIDLAIIDNYLAANGIVAIPHASGLRYVIHKEGTGISPVITDVVNVDYVGSFLDGGEFDANTDIEFPLNQLIVGWQIGFPLLKEGDEATFYIPSGLGYGGTPPPGIPLHANLVFDVTLNSVVR